MSMLLLLSSSHIISMMHALLLPAFPQGVRYVCHNMHKYKRISYTSKRHRPPFDNDAIVGKASEISWDVGLRVLKVHELGLGFP